MERRDRYYGIQVELIPMTPDDNRWAKKNGDCGILLAKEGERFRFRSDLNNRQRTFDPPTTWKRRCI